MADSKSGAAGHGGSKLPSSAPEGFSSPATFEDLQNKTHSVNTKTEKGTTGKDK